MLIKRIATCDECGLFEEAQGRYDAAAGRNFYTRPESWMEIKQRYGTLILCSWHCVATVASSFAPGDMLIGDDAPSTSRLGGSV